MGCEECFHNPGLAVLVGLRLALVTWLIREIKNYHMILQIRFTQMVSSGHRGCALVAVTVILAACVSVDGGIEDFFVRQALPEVAGLGTARC